MKRDEFLTLREAVEAFPVLRGERVLRGLVRKRLVRHIRVDWRIMFNREHLAADLAALEVAVDAEAVAREARKRAEARANIHFEHPRLAQVLA